MICSAVVTVVLAAFSAAVVLGTAGFASAGVTSVPVVVGVPSPSPLALIDWGVAPLEGVITPLGG
jgi:hypothetical protein